MLFFSGGSMNFFRIFLVSWMFIVALSFIARSFSSNTYSIQFAKSFFCSLTKLLNSLSGIFSRNTDSSNIFLALLPLWNTNSCSYGALFTLLTSFSMNKINALLNYTDFYIMLRQSRIYSLFFLLIQQDQSPGIHH